MKLKSIYIISWFGNDDVAQRRRDYHTKQLAWVFQNNLKPVVYAQHYNKEDFKSGVEYIVNDKEIKLPGHARDCLLEKFYASDEDWAIFADDDSVLHEGQQHCDSKNFVEVFNNIDPELLGNVDAFIPINPANMPFNKLYAENTQTFQDNLVFKRSTAFKGSFFVLKNLRKFYNKPIYFDQTTFTDSTGKMIGGADIDFGLQLMQNDFGVYQCQNIVLREFGHTVSTWTQGAKGHGGDTRTKSRECLINKYKLSTNKAGNIMFRSVYKNNPNPSSVVVKKQQVDNE
jgi:hypothetical protein